MDLEFLGMGKGINNQPPTGTVFAIIALSETFLVDRQPTVVEAEQM
jgi:hypothetical protein